MDAELKMTFKTAEDATAAAATVALLGFMVQHFDNSRDLVVRGQRASLESLAEAIYQAREQE